MSFAIQPLYFDALSTSLSSIPLQICLTQKDLLGYNQDYWVIKQLDSLHGNE